MPKFFELSLIVSVSLLLGAGHFQSAWALSGQSLVAASQAAAEAKALLSSSEGRAAMAKALSKPGAVEELGKIIGSKRAQEVARNPEAARAALLEKLSAAPDAAIVDRASALLGVASRSLELGKADPTLEEMQASLFDSEAAARRIAGPRYSASAPKTVEGGKRDNRVKPSSQMAGTADTAAAKLVENIIEVVAKRAQGNSHFDGVLVQEFNAAARRHPEWLGEGLAKACGAEMNDSQLTTFMSEFSKTLGVERRDIAARTMIQAMAAEQGLALEEAKARVCQATRGCDYVRLPEACE